MKPKNPIAWRQRRLAREQVFHMLGGDVPVRVPDESPPGTELLADIIGELRVIRRWVDLWSHRRIELSVSRAAEPRPER